MSEPYYNHSVINCNASDEYDYDIYNNNTPIEWKSYSEVEIEEISSEENDDSYYHQPEVDQSTFLSENASKALSRPLSHSSIILE